MGLMGLPLLALLLICCANWWVIKSTEDKVLTDISLLNGRSVALVLGTSNKLRNGSSNPYFANRIKAAAELYSEGKVSHFILSGDNRSKYYNEPVEMRKALMLLGVPDSVITLDYAGLRTLDSIVRSNRSTVDLCTSSCTASCSNDFGPSPRAPRMVSARDSD